MAEPIKPVPVQSAFQPYENQSTFSAIGADSRTPEQLLGNSLNMSTEQLLSLQQTDPVKYADLLKSEQAKMDLTKAQGGTTGLDVLQGGVSAFGAISDVVGAIDTHKINREAVKGMETNRAIAEQEAAQRTKFRGSVSSAFA